MKHYLLLISSFLLLLFFSIENVKACHGNALINYSYTVGATGVTVKGTSPAVTCGCDPYRMEVEVRCNTMNFTGTSTNNSATMNKPSCVDKTYPDVFIPFSGLCPGVTYKFRSREYVVGSGSAGPWYTTFTFTTPGTTPTLNVTASATPTTICRGSCATISASASGACGGPYTYTWDNALGTGASKNVCPTTTTTYNVTARDACSGITRTVPVTVTVNPIPTVTVNNATICAGQSATLTATPSTTGGTYSWNTGATTQSITVSPGSTTSYSVVYTLNGCPSSSVSGTVTVNPAPSVTVSNATICAGQSATLTATPSATGGTYLWNNGATTQSITVSPASTTSYSVVYTLNGCPSLSASGTVTVNPIPTVTVNSPNICTGQSATLTATPSTTGGTYLWDNGATTQSITVSPASTTSYSVVYTLNGCPSTSVSGTVTVNPIPTVTVNNETICNGQSATLTATPSPTTGGTYSWSNGETTQSIVVSPSTTTSYSVIYTLNGCSSSSVSGTVTVDPTPTVTVNDVTICMGENATLAATPSIAGGTYLWSTGATSQGITVTPNSTTVYSVTYTLNGCSSIPGEGTVTVNPVPVVSATPNSEEICSGSTTNINLTSNVVNTTIDWTVIASSGALTGASPGSGQSIAHTLLNSGNIQETATYTITPTANGCTGAPIDVIITVNPIPVVTPTPSTQTLCSGSTTKIDLTSTVANTTFDWTVVAGSAAITGATAGSGATIAQVLNNSGSTSETVTYTITPTANGCLGLPVDVTITVDPIPSVTATPNSQVLCSGSATSINLTSDVASATFNWTVATSSAAITGASAGSGSTIAQTLINSGNTIETVTYTVTPTANGCPGVPINVIITVNPIPVATTTPASQAICSGSSTSINLTSTVANTAFDWTVITSSAAVTGASAGTGSSIIQSLNNSGNTPETATYTITPTANNCIGTPVDVAVTVNPIPAAVATPASQAICSGSITSIDLTSNVTGTTFTWTSSSSSAAITGASSGTGTTIAQTLNNSGNTSGTVTYTITPTANGCVGTAIFVVITVNPIPTVIPTPSEQTICTNNNTDITLSSNVANTTFDWTVVTSSSSITGISAGAGTSISQTLHNSATTPGTATYTITGTSPEGCSNTATAIITVNPPLNVINSGNTSFCIGDNDTLNASASGGDGVAYNYSWSPVTGLNNPNINNPVANPTTSTVYTVTVTDNCGTPSASSSLTVTVNPLPSVIFTGDSSGCVPLPVQFINLSDTGSYSWDFGDGNTYSGNNPTHTYQNVGSYDAYLTVIDLNGCENTSGAFKVQVNPNPEAYFTMGPQPTTILDPLIKFSSDSSSTDVTSWNWDFTGLNSSIDPSPIYSFPDTGKYEVELLVTNQFGCVDSITREVVILGDFTIYIPNAFTPDGDGLNDFWGPQGIGITEGNFQMMIFNRWGELIYNTNDFHKPWNGIPNNSSSMAKQDVYVYKIIVKDSLGKKHQYKGHFSLLK